MTRSAWASSTTSMCSGRAPSVMSAPEAAWPVEGTAIGRVSSADGDLSGTRHARREQVHARRADEAGDEEIGRMVVDLERRSDLLDASGTQHHDAVGQRHRLDLIVSDIDHGAADLRVQRGELLARGDAQLRIEVRQRLVEQEDLGIADDRAADGDALALAARESLRLAVEIVGEPQHLGGAADALVDLAPA